MNPIRVLLVDDEEIVSRGIRALLEKVLEGFSLAAYAPNGLKALELMEFQEFDLVITDIRMPGMDGIELIKRISVRTPGIPIIVLSGHDDYEYLRTALRYGVTDYLMKPVERSELSECLSKIATGLRQKAQAPTESSQIDSTLVRQIKQMVTDHLHEDISLKSIAGHVNYSYCYLSTLFKQQTGMSFSEYLQTKRLQKARRLLVESRLKVYEIATRCGYPNTKYFISLFSRIVGLTPTEFRNQSDPSNM